MDKDLSVNQRIKFLIEDYSKLTQRAFAEKLGVSQSAISSLFSQRENRPGLDMLQKIAIAYPEVSTDWLLIGNGSMLRTEVAATSQEQPLSVIRREIKDLIINSLGLGQAEERRLKEANARAQQITSLEAKTRMLKMQMDDLIATSQLVESKPEINDQDREQLLNIRGTYKELADDLHGKYQVLAVLQAEEKRDLREAHVLIGEMTQAVQAALKPATK